MRIGYIVKRFPRASETFIAQEVLGLERLGVEVVIFALRPNDHVVEHDWLTEIAAPVHTYEPQSFSSCWRALQRWSRDNSDRRQEAHRAILQAFDHPKRSGKRYLVESWWIAETARSLGIQHLHAHFANHPAFVAMVAGRLGGLTHSFTAHAKDIYLDGPDQELWHRQLDEAVFAVTVSRGNREFLGSFLSQQVREKVCMLYNGVDLERIRPQRSLAPRRALQVSFAGRLIEKKGADLLLAAASKVLLRFPETVFHLIGDGEERTELEEQARQLGLGDRVVFEGSLPHQKTIHRIATSDLFVLPCRIAANGDRDALPTVLLEAMAAGVPAISTPVNGVPEIIDQGRTGLLVPPDDAASLAAAIEQLLADASTRRRMGREARIQAERRFDLRTSTSRLQSLFESAIFEGTIQRDRPSAQVAAI